MGYELKDGRNKAWRHGDEVIIVMNGRKTNCMRAAFVDWSDWNIVRKYSLCADVRNTTVYVVCSLNGKTIMLHRLLMGCTKDDGVVVDHRSRGGMDNRRSNLRICTYVQNSQNAIKTTYGGKPKSSLYKGVSRCGISRWQACIRLDNKNTHLGVFPKTPEGEIAAAKAYDMAASKHFGEFARLNFPEV